MWVIVRASRGASTDALRTGVLLDMVRFRGARVWGTVWCGGYRVFGVGVGVKKQSLGMGSFLWGMSL